MTPLKPLSPTMHRAYVEALDGPSPELAALLDRLNTVDEDELDGIEREIVAALWWRVLRPDDIARSTLRHHGWERKRALTVAQATVVLAAIGEAGYPIQGNGAPDYEGSWAPDFLPPVRGLERDMVIWSAAKYWASMASRHITYVSLGDARGFVPRPVQYDQPGSMHPGQQSSLTLGPWADRGDECESHAYMRRHTRRLLLVRGDA